jgi:hypothetical protein
MNLITITDEMLESALLEESDKENLKKARHHEDSINLKSFVSQMYIKKLSTEGLDFLFKTVKVQSFKSGQVISLARSVNVLEEKLKEISSFKDENYMVAIPGEFLRGFKAAIDELNKVYLKSLEN